MLVPDADGQYRPEEIHAVVAPTLRMVGKHRPPLFFGVSGCGCSPGGPAVRRLGGGNIFHGAHTLAVGYTLISVLFSINGVFSLLTWIVLHSISALLYGLINIGSDTLYDVNFLAGWRNSRG